MNLIDKFINDNTRKTLIQAKLHLNQQIKKIINNFYTVLYLNIRPTIGINSSSGIVL